MAEFLKLKSSGLNVIREQDPYLLSFNVEFAEVTGGTFWKAYPPEVISGEKMFDVDMSGGIAAAYKDLMQVYPPINLYNEKLRKLTKQLGTKWMRVSGTWATKTYYDFDGEYKPGEVPEGFLNVLTKEQWVGVLDFVKECNLKLMVSVSGCPGVYGCDSAPVPAWTPKEAEKLFKFSKDYGVEIQASEFVNEPNMLSETGFPKGYTAEDHARDQKIFQEWLYANYPGCLYVGPGSVGEAGMGSPEGATKGGGGIELLSKSVNCAELMGEDPAHLDVFSYHYYNGVSERLGGVMPQAHWLEHEALTEGFLDVAANSARVYGKYRDKFAPGKDMWVTESGDAGGGGDTWASTYLDVPRTLNEAGTFSQLTRGIIYHNTLTASDYAWLDRITHDTRPNYYAVKLWDNIMGTTVLDPEEEIRVGAHVFAHSRADGKEGVAYCIVNNNELEATTLELPKQADVYLLSPKDGKKRATIMQLNGVDLVLDADNNVPEMKPVVKEGTVEVPPMCCAFIVL